MSGYRGSHAKWSVALGLLQAWRREDIAKVNAVLSAEDGAEAVYAVLAALSIAWEETCAREGHGDPDEHLAIQLAGLAVNEPLAADGTD